MKKFLAKLICLMLLISASVLGLVACSESSWEGKVTLKNSGAVIENGGFIAETENYLYFINGIESSTADNTMGTPLKGALLVADKNDLSKTEVVVPKLMVASNYASGVFIDNGYAYYATPSTEKNSEGEVANDELSFARTKLDGSGKTDNFFTLDFSSAISTEYRFVKGENGVVYLYYYDTENTAIICYNTSAKTSTTVIKQSKKANGNSLDKHIFIKAQDMTDVVAYYTTTVYTDTYNEEAASKPNYTRAEAIYNRVYVIKAGSTTGELLVDGDGNSSTQIDDVKYSLSLIKDGYVFFKTTNSGRTDNYAISVNDAKESANWTDSSKITKIYNAAYVDSSTLIVSLSEIYVLGDTKVYQTTFLAKDDLTKRPIALKEDINKLLFMEDNFMYFYNTEGHIAKFDVNAVTGADDTIILVSEDTASTGWYDVEVKEIGGKKYLFYCDTSVTGKSYIKCVDLSANVIEKDTDGDDVNDLFYLDTEKIIVLGKMTDKDCAAVFESKVETQATFSPANGIGFNAEDDEAFYDIIMELKDEYNALSSSVKNLITIKTKNTIDYIERAFEWAEEYKKLDGIALVGSAEEAEELGIKLIYDEMKDTMNAFKDSEYRDGVDVFISDNLKANWTKAVKLFEGEE